MSLSLAYSWIGTTMLDYSCRTRYLTVMSLAVSGQILASGFLLSILSFGGAITGNIVAGIPRVASWRRILLIAIGLVLTLRR